VSTAIDLFIEEARGVSVTEAAKIAGYNLKGKNFAGPCPACGGDDRFSISARHQAWNCRGCGKGGRDGIGLIALVNGYDLHSRAGFLTACAELTGKAIPEGGEVETDADKRDREARLAERKAENAKAAANQARQENEWRDKEMAKARGIYLHAPEDPCADVVEYLRLRTGFEMHPAVFLSIRGIERCTYWHGKDDRGYEQAWHTGPAMVAPFITLERKITGCHQTWIDLGNKGRKYRPDLGVDDKGKPLPPKKMRGTKKGSLIPLFGLMTAARWVGGEGIENGLAIAGSEGFREDSFYFAAGDLGNLAGPRDPASDFFHPELVKEDARGRMRRVKVEGPVPLPDRSADDAMQVPEHVTELILIGDGDSEPVATASKMLRAQTRFSRPGRDVFEWPAPPGFDFAGLMAVRG
jgi:hypothetical protein